MSIGSVIPNEEKRGGRVEPDLRSSEGEPMVCRACGAPHLRRLPREGFWQKKFFSLFGLYPWECPICRRLQLYRRRRKRV